MTAPAPIAAPARPDVRAFLDYLNVQGGPAAADLPAEVSRKMFRALTDLAELPLGDLAVVRDVHIPSPHGTIPARLYDARETRQPGPVVVYFHGGGFVLGDLHSHGPLCAEIARFLDLPVVAVDYRLAPEHPFPAAPEDCEAAARWVADTPGALGRGVSGLVLAGDSAGGTMAIVTALALRDRPALAPVLVQAPFYPSIGRATEFASFETYGSGYFLSRESMDFFATAYAPDADDWRAVPTLGSLTGLPPALVITAELDPIRDEGRHYAAALAEAGVPVVFREARGTIHGFATMRKAIPSAQGDVAGALAALKPMIVEASGMATMHQAERMA